jgi:hypothetical protein
MNQRILTTRLTIASCLITGILLTTIAAIEPAIAKSAKINKIINRAPFYSQAGRFSIDFPTPPTTNSEKGKEGITSTFFKAETPSKSYYLVSFADIPDVQDLSRTGLRKALNEITSGFTTTSKTKLVYAKDIQLGSNLGKEFQFTESGEIFLGRVYIVGERLYTIMTNNSQPANYSFLNSFRLR